MQKIINIGVAADDGTGDKLRTAGAKINANFTELYAPLVSAEASAAAAAASAGNAAAAEAAIEEALSIGGGDIALRGDLALSTGAALVRWVSSAIGAVARTVADKLSDAPLAPEDFGAKADDPTFDNGPKLAAMAAAIAAAGGGAAKLKHGATYWVGAQVENSAGPPDVGSAVMRYAPVTPHIMEIAGCSRTVIIDLNGATIKCRAGLKYGSFNADGTPFVGQATLTANAATPYFSIINIHDNSGDIFVRLGELDGNIANQTIGGGFGDTGIQFPMYGVEIGSGNSGRVRVLANSHSQGLDGALIEANGSLGTVDDIDVSGNYHGARQGISLTAGVGVTIGKFGGIRLRRVGRDIGSMAYSLPGAGIDIEAEVPGKWIDRIAIYDPDIADNQGSGINVVDAANIGSVKVVGGTLIGTTAFAFWAQGPRFVMEDTVVVGSALLPYTATNQRDRSRFKRVRFTNDVSLSPSGTLYLFGADPLAAHNSGTENPIFDECAFDYVTDHGSDKSVYFPNGDFIDCSFQGPAGTVNYLGANGTFSGRRTDFAGATVVTIPRADLAASLFKNYAGQSFDSFTYNGTRYAADSDRSTGKKVFYGSTAYDPPSLAAGAKDAIHTTTVTGAAVGDFVTVSFSNDLAGARIPAWVSAPNTVSFYAINENGANPLDLASGNANFVVRQA